MEGKIGTIKAGAFADITVNEAGGQRVYLVDSYGNSLPADKIMIPQFTMKNGKTRYRQIDFTEMFGLVK